MESPPTTGPRRFARYRPSDRILQGRRFWTVPEGGICLSAFLVLRSPNAPGAVLLGKPDPRAPWEEMATLEDAHLRAIGERWILPASHLREFESPHDAGKRILREQLGAAEPVLRGPEVFSETYPSALDPAAGSHWDLHFVFQGDWSSEAAPRSAAWRELKFVDLRSVSRSDIARGHADILALAASPVGDPPPA
jgi:hypothetical protein